MGIVWRVLRGIAFCWDAERVHHLSCQLIQITPSWCLRWISGTPAHFYPSSKRVGLAAGFDKNAVIVQKLPDLGFGFAEIGTVTPRPQEGNPRPRLFRFVERQAIFNQMGFNNLGAEAVANNLAHARKKMKARGGNVATFLVGVNIGKNKETSPEDAPQDYADAIRPFEGLADYVVINVSSPNTPGLRALQTAESLQKIVEATKNVVLRWKSPRPIYLKLAPELHGPELSGLIAASNGWGIEGWVLTNTLGGDFSHPTKGVTWGGWSGSPVAQASLQSLRTVRSQSSLNIDSVGGILSPQAARERVELGADRIQIYSGWVFNGPRFPSQIARFFEK